MNKPDADEILNYLSNKFNKIFCDREFVYSLIQDFEIILNNETKCCVLVFPALGPIYLKALKYQAKLFDLTVFSIGYDKFKSFAVCHKNYLITNSKNCGEEEEIMANIQPKSNLSLSTSRNKRPERKLYVPPAQRRSTLNDNNNKCKCSHLNDKIKRNKSKISNPYKKIQVNNNDLYINKATSTVNKSDNNKLMNLNDITDIYFNLNLIPYCSVFYNNNSDNKLAYFRHWNCEFEKYLNYKKLIDVPIHRIIPIYNLIKVNIRWNYYQSLNYYNLNVKNQKTKILQEEFHDEIIIKQQKSVFLQTYENLLNGFNEQKNDCTYKIICDSKCDDNYEIIDLSSVNLGHYCYISLNNQDYVYACQEPHDTVQCYLNKLNELIIGKNQITNTEVVKNVKTNQPLNEEIIKNKTKNDKKIKNNQHEEEKEIMRRAKENMNRRIRPIIKYVDDEDRTLKIDKNDSVNNWEDLFDDDGKIQDELLTEIVQKVGNDVTVVKATEDYSAYTNKPLEDLEHVVELYNFPSTLATHDLVQAFSEINSDAMYVKWVDDTHALLVLGSYSQAQRAVDMTNSLIKVRPMNAASAIAKDVANKSNLKPAMKRPPTNLQTARRLITSHLGTKSKLSKEQIAKEREDLKNARELKKITKQNAKDAWEGNLKSVVNN